MSFNDTFPLQFVINMDHRTDRLQQVTEQFGRLNLSPMRMPGKVYSDPSLAPQWRGAIGCLLSHLAVLRFAYDMRKNVFIFEDDLLILRSDAPAIMDLACQELESLDWQMLYIGGNILKPFNQVSEHLAKLRHCQSTIAYGVRWNFIEELLSNFSNGIDAPIDVIYADRVIPAINAYITVPMLAIQRDSYSDIEGKEVQYSSYLEKRYWANFVKKLDI